VRVLERKYIKGKSDETTAVGAPLPDPAFQRLWLGLSISYLGDQFAIIALLWFVLQLTGSGAAVGLVILCFDLPGVVTGAILGRLLDRYQPRLVMGFDNLARAALIAAIPTLYALGSLQLWHVFVLALLAGAAPSQERTGELLSLERNQQGGHGQRAILQHHHRPSGGIQVQFELARRIGRRE